MLNARPPLKHKKGSYTVKFRTALTAGLAAFTLPACTSNRNLSPRDTLTVSVGSPITTLNPLYATDAGSQHTSELVHAPLVSANAKFLPEPYLAESFRLVNATTLEFRLRSNCRFHTGRLVTADDVARSLDFFRDEKNQSTFAESFRRIVKFEKVDTLTFRLHTEKPAPSLLADLEILKILDLDGITPGSRPASIPGAGPYRPLSANASLVELSRVPASCLPEPPLATIKIKTVRDDLSRFLKLKTGEVDVVMNELNYRKVEAINADPSLPLQVSTSDGIGYTYLGVNTRSGPLRDRRVRRALALSFDTPALIRYKSRGMATVARNLLEDQNYYANLAVPKVERNLAEARRLLGAAGFNDGKNGRPPLRLTLLTSTASFNIENGQVLIAQAAEAGIELKLKALEWGIFYSDVKAGNTELYLMRWVGVTDPRIYFEAFHSGEIGKGNRTFFSDPRVDKLTAAGEVTMEPAARKKIYDEVQSIVAEELPYIGLWYGKNVIVSRKNVKNIVSVPSASWKILLKASKE
jgi:peptide/nickel transport system substrate-binding protein